MAIYNGEEFLKEQLDSILCQLSEDDELIVVNDCSTDKSEEIIQSIDFKNIKYISNSSNLGVVESFEIAIRASRGDWIFLADQDDVWEGNKLEKCLQGALPQRTLIYHKAEFVNKELKTWDLQPNFKGKFSPSKIFLKNHFIGACMGFSSDLKPYILCKMKLSPMHDWWIAFVVSIIGQIHFVDERLIKYRRHGAVQTTFSTSLNYRWSAVYRRLQMLVLFIFWCLNLVSLSFKKRV